MNRHLLIYRIGLHQGFEYMSNYSGPVTFTKIEILPKFEKIFLEARIGREIFGDSAKLLKEITEKLLSKSPEFKDFLLNQQKFLDGLTESESEMAYKAAVDSIEIIEKIVIEIDKGLRVEKGE